MAQSVLTDINTSLLNLRILVNNIKYNILILTY